MQGFKRLPRGCAPFKLSDTHVDVQAIPYALLQCGICIDLPAWEAALAGAGPRGLTCNMIHLDVDVCVRDCVLCACVCVCVCVRSCLFAAPGRWVVLRVHLFRSSSRFVVVAWPTFTKSMVSCCCGLSLWQGRLTD
jgi:hypothetical protein